MDFKQHQHRLAKLALRFNLMVALVFGLLLTNILMASLVWYTTLHQKTEITPFNSTLGYMKSESNVDMHYLTMMSENFIYLRLNVTPETVHENHKRLLSFASSRGYNDFLAQLNREASLITIKKISSYFEIEDVGSNAKTLTTVIKGTLHRSVGLRALHEARITYTLTYRYHLGRLTLASFTHVEEKAHA